MHPTFLLSGYTLGFWVNFRNAGHTKGIYMSNGGHDATSHGIAMMYKKGKLEFVFRMKNGNYWNVIDTNFLSDKWHHVTVTWEESAGLELYVNGDLVAVNRQPQARYFFSRVFYTVFDTKPF